MVMSTHPKSMPSRAKLEAPTIAAGEFKAKCLKLMDEVAKMQQPVTVTKHGKPIVQIVPIAPAESKPFRSLFGRSPGIKVPNEKEWKKLKSDWAQEWEDSFQKSAQVFEPSKSRKK